MENFINYDFIKKYVEEHTPETDKSFRKMETYAYYNHIPIITKETRRFLQVILQMKQPEKILEIGTAIGYSAIIFALASLKSHITTIEIDEDIFNVAYKNISDFGLSDRINLINDDARNIIPYLDCKYDFIFMDAAKGQYTEYYPWAKKLLKKGGILFSDNILFKGLVADDSLVSRSKRAIVNDLNDFNDNLYKDEDFMTSFIPIGDGVALSLKMN